MMICNVVHGLLFWFFKSFLYTDNRTAAVGSSWKSNFSICKYYPNKEVSRARCLACHCQQPGEG